MKRFIIDWMRLAIFWGTIAFAVVLGAILAGAAYIQIGNWVKFLRPFL